MHLLGFLALACSLLAAALIPGPREAPATAAAFESGLGFSEAEPDGGEVKAFAGKDLEEQLRAVSSVDELMSVLYPDYWKMYKCQLRKGGWQQPTLNTRTGDTVKFAAAHYNTEILKSHVDAHLSVILVLCTMSETSPYMFFPKSPLILCQAVNKTCPANYVWNNYMCRCLAQQDFIFYSNAEGDSTNGFHDVCGPNKELDEDTCQCVCKGGLRPSSCGPHKELDRNSCQCVCKNKLFPSSCGANREFDENTCQCVCKRTCPRNQPLNPGKCACECTENTQKCFLKGKKFHHQTCRINTYVQKLVKAFHCTTQNLHPVTDRHRDTDPHQSNGLSSQGPVKEQKEGEDEQGGLDR
ncbi:Vascular endothelial growth factor C [Microtus ochrogaster]|uniref:Vascular endothelial growth factor C n=1 Tax=Microtus ochrogaster TaxID=79684 RepID=A0A8J6GS12_MICOH|nr:Vascular endothelial growth factor C [Microtus ochrogaster]